MRGGLLTRGCAAALIAWVAPLGTAAAETPADGDSFRVSVHGVVLNRCGLTQQVATGTFKNPASINNTARADELSLPFQIDCNSGFSLSLSSRNGGLASASATSDGDFARLLSYSASILLPTGARTGVCASGAMGEDGAGCTTRFEPEAASGGVVGEGRIDLTLAAGAQPLMAGRYSDHLVITLSPDVGGAGGS